MALQKKAGLKKRYICVRCCTPNYFDRICAVLLAALAGSQFLSGQGDEARDTLIRAKELTAIWKSLIEQEDRHE